MPEEHSQLVSLGETGISHARSLFGLSRSDLAALMAELGEPSWRGAQLAGAIYYQRLEQVSAITTFSKDLRDRIGAAGWTVARPRIAQVFRSVDGTERYLVEGQGRTDTVETVWMPEGDEGEAGDGSDADENEAKAGFLRQAQGGLSTAPAGRASGRRNRATICVSSQMGCAVNCQFCLTGKLGLQRNLTAGEIAGQVVAVLDRRASRLAETG